MGSVDQLSNFNWRTSASGFGQLEGWLEAVGVVQEVWQEVVHRGHVEGTGSTPTACQVPKQF
jgi:hypothetical protein